MKLYSIFTIFVALVDLITVSGVAKSKALQTAFVDIANFLAEWNHLVTVVAFENVISDSSKAIIFDTTSDIPHKVLHIRKDSWKVWQFDCSAIVSFFSSD